MKKVIIGVVAFFVLILVALVVFPIVFKDDIIAMVKEETNKNINAVVDFGDFDLSMISTFPHFHFEIHDVSIVGIDEFEGVTLLEMGTFETTLDINSVLEGEQYKIKSFEIIDLVSNAIVLKDGTANWDIMIASDEEETEVEETTEETKFKLGLDYYAIENANIVYDDKPGNMYVEIKNFNHEGEGDFTEDIFLLETTTYIESMTYKMDGVKYLNKVSLNSKFDIDIDMVNSKYTFNENT